MTDMAHHSADFEGGSLGRSWLEEKLTDIEVKMIRREADKHAYHRGYRNVEHDPDGDMVVNDLIWYWLDSKTIGKAQGIEPQAVFHQLKKRVRQTLLGDPLTTLFRSSDHYKREFRKAWAIAIETHPADDSKAADLAYELFHERKNSQGHKAGYAPDQRTQDAFGSLTAHYEQLSLFSQVGGEEEAVELIEVLPDSSGVAPDDSYQMNFLDEVMSDDGPFDLRQQLICTYLMEEPKPTYEEIGKRMEPPCSSSTIGEEVKKIRELSLGLLDAMEIT